MTSTDAEYKGRRILLVGRASRLLPVVAAEFQEQGARVVLADPAIPGDTPVSQRMDVDRLASRHARNRRSLGVSRLPLATLASVRYVPVR
jgi:hypothetical protein